MTGVEFMLLVVCHANLCRSPMAERLARRMIEQRVGTGTGVAVASAGTHARPGLPMHPFAAQALREVRIPVDDFRSEAVTAPLLAAAGLVLTADREQRAWCVRRVPAIIHRTFTLREFARLSAAVARADLLAGPPYARLYSLVGRLATVRDVFPPADSANDSIEDPVSQPVRVFRRCAGQLGEIFDVMTDLIRPD